VITPELLRKFADAAEKYDAKAVKVTGAMRIAIVGLKEEDLDAVWRDLDVKPGAAVGLCVRSVKACPGTAFCKRGQQDSLGLGMKFDEKYHSMEMPNKFKIGVSGCPNNCADAPVCDVGLTGMPKGWKLWAGGCLGARPRLGEIIAENLTTEQAEAAVDKIVGWFKENGKRNERLGRAIDRVGMDKFKQAVLDVSV
jgi:NAD(P)H-nitrite reductase large subunit